MPDLLAVGLDGSSLYRPRIGGDIDVWILFRKDKNAKQVHDILLSFYKEIQSPQFKAKNVQIRPSFLDEAQKKAEYIGIPALAFPHKVTRYFSLTDEEYDIAIKEAQEYIRKFRKEIYRNSQKNYNSLQFLRKMEAELDAEEEALFQATKVCAPGMNLLEGYEEFDKPVLTLWDRIRIVFKNIINWVLKKPRPAEIFSVGVCGTSLPHSSDPHKILKLIALEKDSLQEIETIRTVLNQTTDLVGIAGNKNLITRLQEILQRKANSAQSFFIMGIAADFEKNPQSLKSIIDDSGNELLKTYALLEKLKITNPGTLRQELASLDQSNLLSLITKTVAEAQDDNLLGKGYTRSQLDYALQVVRKEAMPGDLLSPASTITQIDNFPSSLDELRKSGYKLTTINPRQIKAENISGEIALEDISPENLALLESLRILPKDINVDQYERIVLVSTPTDEPVATLLITSSSNIDAPAAAHVLAQSPQASITEQWKLGFPPKKVKNLENSGPDNLIILRDGEEIARIDAGGRMPISQLTPDDEIIIANPDSRLVYAFNLSSPKEPLRAKRLVSLDIDAFSNPQLPPEYTETSALLRQALSGNVVYPIDDPLVEKKQASVIKELARRLYNDDPQFDFGRIYPPKAKVLIKTLLQDSDAEAFSRAQWSALINAVQETHGEEGMARLAKIYREIWFFDEKAVETFWDPGQMVSELMIDEFGEDGYETIMKRAGKEVLGFEPDLGPRVSARIILEENTGISLVPAVQKELLEIDGRGLKSNEAIEITFFSRTTSGDFSTLPYSLTIQPGEINYLLADSQIKSMEVINFDTDEKSLLIPDNYPTRKISLYRLQGAPDDSRLFTKAFDPEKTAELDGPRTRIFFGKESKTLFDPTNTKRVTIGSTDYVPILQDDGTYALQAYRETTSPAAQHISDQVQIVWQDGKYVLESDDHNLKFNIFYDQEGKRQRLTVHPGQEIDPDRLKTATRIQAFDPKTNTAVEEFSIVPPRQRERPVLFARENSLSSSACGPDIFLLEGYEEFDKPVLTLWDRVRIVLKNIINWVLRRPRPAEIFSVGVCGTDVSTKTMTEPPNPQNNMPLVLSSDSNIKTASYKNIAYPIIGLSGIPALIAGSHFIPANNPISNIIDAITTTVSLNSQHQSNNFIEE